MKLILSLAVTICVIVALLIKPLRRHIWAVMGMYSILVICLFAFYNYRTKDLILPFYTPTNQMFYQTEFATTEDGVYPDALLHYLVNGKTVYLPKYVCWEGIDIESDEVWNNGQMMCINLVNILKSCGAEVVNEDNSELANVDAFGDKITNLGYLNDTFRYSFLYNDLTSEYGNSFYYLWFYGASKEPFRLYVYGDGIQETDELVLLMDTNLDIFLIPKDKYMGMEV